MAQTNQNGIISKTAGEMAAKPRAKTMKDWVTDMLPEISKALPNVITPERFSRIVLTALSSNPTLAKCDRNSFLGAMMQCAQVGLEPNTPEGKIFLIPYMNNKKGAMEVQVQFGTAGVLELAYRANLYVDAKVVYENDEFYIEYGLNPVLKHKPALKNRGAVIGYYAIWKGENNAFGFTYLSKEDAEAHGKRYSKSYNSGPWATNFDEMAKKTVIKQVLKYAPKSTEFARAISADMGTVTADPEDLSRDLNIVYDTEEVEEVKEDKDEKKEG